MTTTMAAPPPWRTSLTKAREELDRVQARERVARAPKPTLPRPAPRVDRPSVVPSFEELYGPLREDPPLEELDEAPEPDDDGVYASNEDDPAPEDS